MNLKNMSQKKLKKSGGFTLVEMLIVVAIIVILVVVSIPMISGNLEEARKATDAANERAAKSVALIEYMNGNTTSPLYYDAAAGTVSGTQPTEGYNQAEQPNADSSGNLKKGEGVVKVTVTVADTGEVTMDTSWAPKK